MKKIIVSFIFILCSCISIAQDSLHAKRSYKNKVSLHWTYSDYPKVLPSFYNLKHHPIIPQQFGVDVEHKIYKNINAIIGFAKWNESKIFKGPMPDGQYINGPDRVYKKGVIEYRKKYRMVDFLFSYKFDKFNRHKIDIGIGPSYHWGINTIIDTIEYNGFEAFMRTSDHKAHYWGVIYMFNYDYLLFKNRIAIGIDVKYRKYNAYRIAQVDYSPHIALVF